MVLSPSPSPPPPLPAVVNSATVDNCTLKLKHVQTDEKYNTRNDLSASEFSVKLSNKDFILLFSGSRYFPFPVTQSQTHKQQKASQVGTWTIFTYREKAVLNSNLEILLEYFRN